MSDAVSGESTEGPIFISVEEAAQRLGLKTWDVYRLIRDKELAHLPRERGEQIRILAADLPRWAAEASRTEAAS